MKNKKILAVATFILFMTNIVSVQAGNTESDVGVYFEEIVPNSKVPNIGGESPSLSPNGVGKLPQTGEIKKKPSSILGIIAVSPALILLYSKKKEKKLRGEWEKWKKLF